MKRHAATVRSDWLAKIMHALKLRLDMVTWISFLEKYPSLLGRLGIA